MDRNCVTVRKCNPQMIKCKPVNTLEPEHQFEVTKVYLFNDNDGHETAVVICPKHNVPIQVEPVHVPRRPREAGKG